VLLCVALGANAKKEREYPRAKIKVGYNYYNKFLRGGDGVVEKNTPFILLANQEQSKFYCPSTEYRDSLLSTPSGRAKERQMFDAAAAAYVQNRDRSAMDCVVYHSRLYVTKDFAKSVSTTYDQAGMGEYGYYDEPFSEIDWQIVEDSTKTVLGYQCIMASTDYHGRKWTVWFTPEIPVQDGPWKFCGLPGLILEAAEEKGHHHFTADGIEQSSQSIYPIYNNDYEKMGRLDMLRNLRNYRDNNNSIIKASTGGMLDFGPDAPVQTEYDFLETDYR
ncbi:GLPGLI family protein, partial [uncultured Muribaculum sp.]|uniref:GLPGLI family protein n=1 Tax=uncultured Muribaculum sp. TaxID=1918613 RepID=UPI0025B74826